MNIIVNGATGHLGQLLLGIIESKPDLELAAGVSHSGSNGTFASLSEYDGPADVVIDFSHHDGTKDLLDYCISRNLPVVVCTTGQTEEELAMIKDAGTKIPVFKSANMSVGVALLAKLVKETSAVFNDCDVEIVEIHHNRKLDAPSGTAIMLADAVKETRPDVYYNTGRSGQCKREPNEIGITAVRRGNVVGTHEVMFGTNSQTITLTHEAHDRALFADGAVDAAKFLVGKPAGLYDMNDLLA